MRRPSDVRGWSCRLRGVPTGSSNAACPSRRQDAAACPARAGAAAPRIRRATWGAGLPPSAAPAQERGTDRSSACQAKRGYLTSPITSAPLGGENRKSPGSSLGLCSSDSNLSTVVCPKVSASSMTSRPEEPKPMRIFSKLPRPRKRERAARLLQQFEVAIEDLLLEFSPCGEGLGDKLREALQARCPSARHRTCEKRPQENRHEPGTQGHRGS